MALVYSGGQMAKSTKDSLKQTSSRVRGLRLGRMERDTRDSLLRMNSRVKVSSAGQMVADMREPG